MPWLGIPQKRVCESRVDSGACCCLALSFKVSAVVVSLRGSFPVTFAGMKQLIWEHLTWGKFHVNMLFYRSFVSVS